MRDSNKSNSDFQEKSKANEPEWVKRIVELYEKIRNDKERLNNSKTMSSSD